LQTGRDGDDQAIELSVHDHLDEMRYRGDAEESAE
jgi:hypothetical protein